MGEQVFFVRWNYDNDPPLAYSVCPDEQLPLDDVARDFQLLPESINSELRRTLAQVRHRNHLYGSAAVPFYVTGTRNMAPGFTAEFQPLRGDFPCPEKLQITERLHLCNTSAVYSVKDVSSSSSQGGDGSEDLVLKLLLNFPTLPGALNILGSQEEQALYDIKQAKATMPMPSLQEFVEFGRLLASDGSRHPACGDCTGYLTKPRGVCVKGKVFNVQQLCKAAFDLLLALYHLYLLERRHREVKAENVVYVETHNQFVLVDLKLAFTEGLDYGHAHDCIQLVECLVEMAGGNCTAEAAPVFLASSAPLLGRFARYALTLHSPKASPDYDYWLHELAAECGVPIDHLATMLKKYPFKET